MNRPSPSRHLPVLILLLISALVIGAHAGLRTASARQQIQSGGPDVPAAVTRLLTSDSRHLNFILDVPYYNVDAAGAVVAPGLHLRLDEPGAPALPAFSTYIALPPGADPQVEVQTGETRVATVNNVRPVPQIRDLPPDDNVLDLVASLGEPLYERDQTIYSSTHYYPEQSYRLSAPMYFRDLRVVRLDLFPLRYNPGRQILEHTQSVEVSVRFSGADWANAQPISGQGEFLRSIAPLVLNFEQAQNWRSVPAQNMASATVLPTNHDTFKIAVDEDGVYEMTYEELQDAGMEVGSIDPATFEMMYRGEPVAYDFIGDDDPDFEEGEKIRFYGWAFDGSRLERQFLTENVFWLWANGNGSPQPIGERDSNVTNPVATSFRESITREPEAYFTWVRTDDWDSFPNEPDAWYWERVRKHHTDSPTKQYTYEITLPTPVQSGPDAVATVEILNRHREPDHHVSVQVNGNSAFSGELHWQNLRSVNVSTTVPMTAFVNGTNQVQVLYHTPVISSELIFSDYYMNRITVNYQRGFVAEDDLLIFDDGDGHSTYQISGFSNGDANDILVWDISDRLSPERINGATKQGSGPFTYIFGTDAGGASFVVTHEDNLLRPVEISKYVGPDLDPAAGATWLAISHGNFLAQAQQLAAHRSTAAYGGFATYVVDVADVINQYGYGLPLPVAIQNYLQHALTTWSSAPEYVLLVGDGNINPRHLTCQFDSPDCNWWGTSPETNYVLTDMVFTDQFAGLNASDYTFALLTGDDLLPDMAVGRLAVQTATEAQNIIQKIIHYESVRRFPQDWQQNVLFVADNSDNAGEFCEASTEVALALPSGYITQTVCLPSNAPEDILQTRTAIHEAVNNPPEHGVTFLNYRGHGARRSWAGALLDLTADDPWTPWFNNEPAIIISMDCLDGDFAIPGYEALSEEFLALQDYGTAAHWSSTGLGYDFQHERLHQSFYDGLFNYDITAIGDAINYAKLVYALQSHHPSQLYSFTLQGDPAMQMLTTGSLLYLPAVRN